MAKREKQHPNFECTEYDYGNLDHRQYEGNIFATLKFSDGVDIIVFFDFKDFLDYHKRKKSHLHRTVESIYHDMRGWGSRYFELIELLQEEEDVDLFELFVEYVEETEEELVDKYEARRYRIQELNRIKPPKAHDELKVKEITGKKHTPATSLEEEEDDEDEVSPYDRDRAKFEEVLKLASNDMYEALKSSFFPQMEYFQRRYPSRWKTLTENLEMFFQNFEDEMLHEMLPQLDEDEYREFDIKYNSQKADMSDEEEPPTAR